MTTIFPPAKSKKEDKEHTKRMAGLKINNFRDQVYKHKHPIPDIVSCDHWKILEGK